MENTQPNEPSFPCLLSSDAAHGRWPPNGDPLNWCREDHLCCGLVDWAGRRGDLGIRLRADRGIANGRTIPPLISARIHRALPPWFRRSTRTPAILRRTLEGWCGISSWLRTDFGSRARRSSLRFLRVIAKLKMPHRAFRIPHEGREIVTGLAHSWPRQGIPMTEYGIEVRARYSDA